MSSQKDLSDHSGNQDNFEKVRLGDICQINPDSVNDEEFEYTDIKYLTIGNAGTGVISEIDEHEISEAPSRAQRWVKSGDTVISRVRPGRKQYVYMKDPPENMVVSSGFVVIRPNNPETLLPRYVYYATTSPEFIEYLEVNATGSAYPSTNISEVRKAEIPVPSTEVQEEIVETLGSIDDKIENNQRMNNQLGGLSQLVFRNWFINFGPFADSNMVHHESLGQDIPSDWDVIEMSEIARIVDCLHSKKPDRQEEGNFYIEVNDIGENGELYLNDKYLISEEDYDQWTKRITAKPGDVIISKDGRVGAVAQIPRGVEGAIGRNIVCIRPDSDRLSPQFLREYMLSPLMRQEIGEKTLSRSIFETLHVSEIEDLRVLLPPKDVRKKFDNIVDPIHNLIESNIKEIMDLRELRDHLHPHLISGNIGLTSE